MNGRFSAFVWLFGFLSIAAPAFAQPEPAAESAVAATVGDDPIRSGRSPADDGRDLPRQEADRRPAADGPGPGAGRDRQSAARACLRPPGRRCPRAPRNWPRPRRNCRSAWPHRAARFPTCSRPSRSPRPTSSGRSSGGWFGTATWPNTARPSAARPGSRTTMRDLDGTELVVSHILLRPAAGAGPQEIEDLEKQAESIRAEIASGKIDFAAAAEKYSAGPSGKQGGRLGKIGRHGPMDESFSLRRLPTQGRRDQSAGPFALRRTPDPLRRGRARNEEAFRSHRADRRGPGQGAAGENLAERTPADAGEIHVGLAAFQTGDAGTGKVVETGAALRRTELTRPLRAG